MANIEEHIRQAMQEGKFANLAGSGKPINLDENPFEDAEWSAAYRALRSGGFSLPWIEKRKEIEAELERARADLLRTWKWRQTALAASQPAGQVDFEWQRAMEQFSNKIVEINRRIHSYNLEAPSAGFQRALVQPEREIERITSAGAL